MNNTSVGLHWLEYTVHDGSPSKTANHLEYFFENDFSDVPGSLYGYIDMKVGKNGIMILSDSRKSHHHVIIPGRWLAEVGEPALLLLITVSCWGYNITRMDIACDNHNVYPDPRELRDKCNDGELVTRFRIRNSIENHTDGSVTNYFGSMRSDWFLRVYDKTKETKGRIVATRWEIVLRKQYAMQAAEHILNIGINETFTTTLRKLVDFRKPTKENRESRRGQMKWYKDFINNADKATYTRYEPGRTLERMEHWLQKQVSKTLAEVVQGKGGDMDYVYDLVETGRDKINYRKNHKRKLEFK